MQRSAEHDARSLVVAASHESDPLRSTIRWLLGAAMLPALVLSASAAQAQATATAATDTVQAPQPVSRLSEPAAYTSSFDDIALTEGQRSALHDAALLPPVVSAAPQNGDNRNVALCGTTCFELTTSYTTVPYVSMDTPRSVTLVYTGNRAHRTGLVQVDAEDVGSQTPPTRLSLKLLQPNGTPFTYPNGQQEVFFQYQAGAGPNRLAVRIDFSSTTSAYKFRAVVTSYWDASGAPTTAVQAAPVPVQMLYVDAYNSPYGWGWDVAGVQHLRFTETGSVSDSILVWDGAGTMQYFRNSGCPASCTYAPPAGEFSTIELVEWSRRTNPDWVFVRSYVDGTKVYFSGAGEQLAVVDPDGNQTTYNWVEPGRLASIVDPTGKAITFQYDGRAKLASITDAAGRVTYVGIDGVGDLTDIVDGRASNVAAFRAGYDIDHLLRYTLDALGQRTDYASDLMLRLASVTLPAVTANGQSVRPTVTYEVGETRTLFNWWAGSGQGLAGTPLPAVVANSLVDRVSDPRGNVVIYHHDRFGAPTRVDEPLGRITLVSRDEHGRPTRIQEPSGRVQKLVYEGANLQQAIDSTANRSVFILYGANGRPSHVMPSDGPGTWYDRYDTPLADRLRADSLHVRVDGSDGITRVVYDGKGRVQETGDPANHPTRYYYSATGFQNTDSVTTSGPRTTRFGYDGVGRLASTRDAAGKLFRTEYDALNRVLRAIGPVNDTTIYGYDARFLRSVRDAMGQVYGFTPNALGWVETATDPRGAITTTGYDAAGNVVSTTDRRGRTVTATYDALGQLASRTADGATTTFSTDPLGRFTTSANAVSVDTMYFDVLGRKTLEVSHRGTRGYVITSGYDARNRRSSVTANGWMTGYHFNALGQLDTLTDVGGGKTSMLYDIEGLLVATKLPSGVQVSTPGAPTHGAGEITYSTTALNSALGALHTYDPLARLGDRLNAAGTSGREFRYDDVGRLTGFADFSIPQNCYRDPDTKERTCNGGDKAYGGASALYTYDAVGNRTDNGAAVELGNRLARFGADSLIYFADGSLQQRLKAGCATDCQHTLQWNSLGQLDGVWLSNTGWITYGYDGWGRRVRRTEVATGQTTWYVYDGDDLALVADDASGLTHVYSNYPGVDRPHSVRTGGAMYYQQLEASGNVVGLIRSDGTLAASYRYDPFGRVVDSTGGVAQHLRYKGREADPSTGLVYMRARWYDPSLGRFIAEDPIGLAGGVNQYAYAGNDPINGRDPMGLDSCANCGGWEWPFSWETLVEMLTGGGRGGSEAGGGGGSAPSNPSTPKPTKPQSKVCRALPSGRTTGATGGIGGIGSVGGGGEIVMNYNSGQTSAFALGGMQIGWNGGMSGSVYTGFVYGLNDANSNYSGGFTGFNVGAGPGIFAASSSGGLTGGTSNMAPNGEVTAYGISLGAGLLSGFSGGVTATNYSSAQPIGRFGAFTTLDMLLFAARQILCK
ncbi:MAG: RHS repeat-associated core domain-containing protein [Gemmatimonadaceae bacterium]|nr:RHS repeat-associated core domain-containing protein [Gemmatimonadaceae bacterium]NUP57354.1 RHS repeat-associated core domain-containing protein [Gemmatimonadaceae bacterium]NUS32230.1 RHS repeat-associated core domain-containing protein [Gemmatimonadaceae bacterium]NUS46284.1 RHS repeat-associated core domain-containing protein [Gemmatimonadaceae bacterium]